MAFGATPIFIPAELRRQIALYCDQGRLARLSLVDRLWAAECATVLYTSMELHVRHISGTPNPIASCVTSITSSAALARLVCTLTIYYPDNDWRAHKLLVHLYEALLPCLHNLSDLRIYEGVYDRASLVPLFLFLASDRVVFRLRALYIPRTYAYIENHPLLAAALRRQPSLQVFGIHLGGGLLLEGHFVKLLTWRNVRPFFVFHRDAKGGETTLALYLPTHKTTALVAPALDSLARVPPRDWSSAVSWRWDGLSVSGFLNPPSPTEVVILRLFVARLPDSALLQLLHQAFPRARDVQFVFRQGSSAPRIDPRAVATAVSPMVPLRALSFELEQFAHPPASGPGDALAIAHAVSDAGCVDLESVRLLDGAMCRRKPDSCSWETSGP